jgi:hypothetical protein
MTHPLTHLLTVALAATLSTTARRAQSVTGTNPLVFRFRPQKGMNVTPSSSTNKLTFVSGSPFKNTVGLWSQSGQIVHGDVANKSELHRRPAYGQQRRSCPKRGRPEELHSLFRRPRLDTHTKLHLKLARVNPSMPEQDHPGTSVIPVRQQRRRSILIFASAIEIVTCSALRALGSAGCAKGIRTLLAHPEQRCNESKSQKSSADVKRSTSDAGYPTLSGLWARSSCSFMNSWWAGIPSRGAMSQKCLIVRSSASGDTASTAEIDLRHADTPISGATPRKDIGGFFSHPSRAVRSDCPSRVMTSDHINNRSGNTSEQTFVENGSDLSR